MSQTFLRPIKWIASAKDDLKSFPAAVQDRMGYALYLAQAGKTHGEAKALKGFGPGVLEIVSNHDGNAFRAVYTVRFARAVYVLVAFQKKSKSGTATPKTVIELIKSRLRAATADYATSFGGDHPSAKI